MSTKVIGGRRSLLPPLIALLLLTGLAFAAARPSEKACAAPLKGSTMSNPGTSISAGSPAAGQTQVGYFDSARIALLEQAGWQAYYDRNWLRVFGLMVQMNREQLCMPLLDAVVGAVDIVRAGAAFAPAGAASDVPTATAHLTRFYEKARRSRHLPADAQTLAGLEVTYWVMHRQLAIARQRAPEHTVDDAPMVDALAALHAALFDASPAAVRHSAELRAEAAGIVDGITGGYTTDVAGDWQRIEKTLEAAYDSLSHASRCE